MAIYGLNKKAGLSNQMMGALILIGIALFFVLVFTGTLNAPLNYIASIFLK